VTNFGQGQLEMKIVSLITSDLASQLDVDLQSSKHANERKQLAEKLQECNRNLLAHAFGDNDITNSIDESSPSLNSFCSIVEEILCHGFKKSI
jgi:hypothetical protein